MTTTPTPDLPTLAKLDAAGIIDQGYPALRLELARLRAENAHRLQVEAELARAVAEQGERVRRSKVVRHVLPSEGTGHDAMVVSLRGIVIARETVDDQEHTYELSGVLGFVKAQDWERLSVQMHESLERAHRRQAGEPERAIVVPASHPRPDLVALIPEPKRPGAMPRETMARALGEQLPLTPLVAGWFKVALDRGGDVAAREFTRRLFARFRAAGLEHLLGDAAADGRAA